MQKENEDAIMSALAFGHDEVCELQHLPLHLQPPSPPWPELSHFLSLGSCRCLHMFQFEVIGTIPSQCSASPNTEISVMINIQNPLLFTTAFSKDNSIFSI